SAPIVPEVPGATLPVEFAVRSPFTVALPPSVAVLEITTGPIEPLIIRVPLLTVVRPVYAFAPVIVSVPVPVFVKLMAPPPPIVPSATAPPKVELALLSPAISVAGVAEPFVTTHNAALLEDDKPLTVSLNPFRSSTDRMLPDSNVPLPFKITFPLPRPFGIT